LGFTLLAYAAQWSTFDIVKLLLQNEALTRNINHADQDGDTALAYGCYRDNTVEDSAQVVQALLEVPGILTNPMNKEGKTPLMIACEYGHTDIVMLLLNYPDVIENINHQDQDGNSAIIIAAAHGHADVVYALLQVPLIEHDLENKDSKSALMLAKEKHLDGVVRLLSPEGRSH
jgi:ankyrin repeat protein